MKTNGRFFRKRIRSKAELPKWFDLNKYDVFWTVGASTWLEQLSIRGKLLSESRKHVGIRPFPESLVKSIEQLCNNPLISPENLLVFDSESGAYANPAEWSNVSQPSGVSILTQEKFWLCAAWLGGENQIRETAKDAVSTAMGIEVSDESTFVDDADDLFECEPCEEDSLDDFELNDPSQSDENDPPEEFIDEFVPFEDDPSTWPVKAAREFYKAKKKIAPDSAEWEELLTVAKVLGPSVYLASIDLTLPDPILREQFAGAIAHLRYKNSIEPQEAKRPAVKNWMNAGVLPYIDLQLWGTVQGLRLSNLALANAILIGQAQGPDTIRNTTRIHVNQLMNPSSAAFRGLIAEARREMAEFP